nr:hypothetical protein Iba_chr14cCG5770 [Ipomoea batatas]
MHLHLLQHVNRTAQLFHGHANPWELIVEDMDLYRGCEDFIDAHGLQEDDVLIFRHVGYFKFHFFVIRNKEQLDLPEAHGYGEAIFIPAMSSINLDVGLTTLSGCRTLAIDFIEFCNDESILSNFIFWTESEGDSVDVRHDTFTLTFINVGEFINYGEQHVFLKRILCRHRNVIRYLVFFNYEVGEVHLIAFDKCGMEIMTDYLYDFTIEEYANADAVLLIGSVWNGHSGECVHILKPAIIIIRIMPVLVCLSLLRLVDRTHMPTTTPRVANENPTMGMVPYPICISCIGIVNPIHWDDETLTLSPII